MARIIEITDLYIIAEENNIELKINIDTIKFEPRINDNITLIRDEQGNIVNVFLNNNEPEIVQVIIDIPTQEQEIPVSPSRAIFASKFVAIYSVVFWLVMVLGVISSLKDYSLFVELFTELELELYLIPIALYILLGVSIGMIALGILLLVIRNKKVKLITIIPLFAVYALMINYSVISLLISPSIAFLQLMMFGAPFFYSIIFFKHYKKL